MCFGVEVFNGTFEVRCCQGDFELFSLNNRRLAALKMYQALCGHEVLKAGWSQDSSFCTCRSHVLKPETHIDRRP